ncbi:hypothetical protein ACLOJK_022554, partial [Asimina triloba]
MLINDEQTPGSPRPQARDGRRSTSSPFIIGEPIPSISNTSSSPSTPTSETVTAASMKPDDRVGNMSVAHRQDVDETDDQNVAPNSCIDHVAVAT